MAYRLAMELDHTEAIKQAVMAQLGVAFVSLYTIRGELATRNLHAVRVRGVPIERHFHVIHNEARALSASAQAFLRTLDEVGATPRRSRSGRRH